MITHDSRPLAEAAGAVLDSGGTSVSSQSSQIQPPQRPSSLGRGVSRANLAPHHRDALRRSAISDDVIDARGYTTLMRTDTDLAPRERLRRAGFPKQLWDVPQRFPGLYIPLYGPNGQLASCQYRPDSPRMNDQGKPRKYEAPSGRPSVLDVHPRNYAKLADPTVPLWITEGVKKGDALTTAGQCAISLSGVYNWRSRHGTLGDWEEVYLRGRTVCVCFDSDARTNRNVARAMRRLGTWLRSRGVAKVLFVLPPGNAVLGKTGVDDYLSRGGTIQELLAVAEATAPDPDADDDSLTDSRLAERVTDEALADSFRWAPGLGWLEFTGRRWEDASEPRVVEIVRRYLRDLQHEAVSAGDRRLVSELNKVQSAARIRAITLLARGVDGVLAHAQDFDAEPFLLNVGNGVVDLSSGELLDHQPDLLMRHGTDVDYRPGASHPDWAQALAALPDPATRSWVQQFLGTGAAGVPPREDVMTFWHGDGSNGKSTLLGACQTALGSYAKALLPTVLGGRREEHPTEFMDLMGARLVFMEETSDGHRLDTTKLKKLQGTEVITARRMRQDPVSFTPSHTLVVTTNHRPAVTDSDHGTWRRLLMVPFTVVFGRDDVPEDLTLRDRVIRGREQQEAVLAWLVEGALRWHSNDQHLPKPPGEIRQATQEWREGTDLIYAFVNDRLRRGGERDFVWVEALREEFNGWLTPPHQPWGKQTFAERFEAHEAMRALGARRGKHPVLRQAVFQFVKNI